jgi:hypothetical protein
MMNLKRFRRKRSGLVVRLYSDFFLEGLRKITKNSSQDGRSSGRDLNPGPCARFEAATLIFECKVQTLLTGYTSRSCNNIEGFPTRGPPTIAYDFEVTIFSLAAHFRLMKRSVNGSAHVDTNGDTRLKI